MLREIAIAKEDQAGQAIMEIRVDTETNKSRPATEILADEDRQAVFPVGKRNKRAV